jgi:hypothetical protein
MRIKYYFWRMQGISYAFGRVLEAESGSMEGHEGVLPRRGLRTEDHEKSRISS